jgi:hypothetical protein
VVADELYPLTWMALLSLLHHVDDTDAVQSSDDEVTDLDHDHVVGQGYWLVSGACLGERPP